MNSACSSAAFCQEHSKKIKIFWESLKMETPNLKSLTQDVRLVQLPTQAVWFLPQSKPNAKRVEVHHCLLWLLRFVRTSYALFSANSLSFLSYQAELPYEERVFKQKNHGIRKKNQINQQDIYVQSKDFFESLSLFSMYRPLLDMTLSCSV